MSRDLQKEYIDLTVQLQEVTRKRNEVGRLLAAQRAASERRSAKEYERATVLALIAVFAEGDWEKARQLTGETDAELMKSMYNCLHRMRTAYPKVKEIPSMVGPRTLKTWPTWEKYARDYLKKIKLDR